MNNPKSKALGKKTMGAYEHAGRLEQIRKSLRKENISYGEIAELGNHKKHLIKSGDTELAEAAGIPEHVFNRRQKRK